MPAPAESAKNTVELGKRHIADRRLRIERLRKLIVRLERDSQFDLVADAVRQLAQMERALVQSEADYSAAQRRLAQDTVDEPSLAKVERDRPM